MSGAQHEEPTATLRAPFALRQALLAIAVALLAIAGISLVSGDDGDGGRDRLAPIATLGSVPQTAATPGTVPLGTGAPGDTIADTTGSGPATAPLDSLVVEDQTTAAAPPASATGAVDPIVSPIGTPDAAGAPTIDARASAVYDVTNDRWLMADEADTPMPVGSVMKLLTSYVVIQAGDLGKVVTVPRLDVDIEESAIGIYEGEQLPRDVLLRAMLIVSANDAARALAIDVGGSIDGFVGQMNDAARQLGMTSTVAANPIGLDASGAQSSAHDMISLAALLMQDETFSAAVARTSANLHGQTFGATNRLLTSYPGATGVKTGHTTQAGYCLIGSATRDGRSLIVAVFGASTDDSRLQGASALLDWGFAQP